MLNADRTETGGRVQFADIQPTQLHFRSVNIQPSSDFWQINQQRFGQQINAKVPDLNLTFFGVSVQIDINVRSAEDRLLVGTNETYSVRITKDENLIVLIEAETIFGARHGLESVAQLIVYDDVQQRLLMRYGVEFSDGPAYGHRGVSLDTARNYFHVDSIKRMIGARETYKGGDIFLLL